MAFGAFKSLFEALASPDDIILTFDAGSAKATAEIRKAFSALDLGPQSTLTQLSL